MQKNFLTKAYFKIWEIKFNTKFLIYYVFPMLLFLFHSVPNYPPVLFQIAPKCTDLPHPDFALCFVFSQKIYVHWIKRKVFIGN